MLSYKTNFVLTVLCPISAISFLTEKTGLKCFYRCVITLTNGHWKTLWRVGKKFVTTRSYRLKMIDLEKMSFISNKTNSVDIKLKQNIGI